MEMKFTSAIFKLGSSEGFSEKVIQLLLSGDDLHFDSVIFNLLTSKMIIDLEVLGFFMKDWIVAEFNATLIVAEDMGRLVVQEFKFFQQSSNPYGFTRALYSDSQEDLEVLDCFLEFHEMGEFPRKNMYAPTEIRSSMSWP